MSSDRTFVYGFRDPVFMRRMRNVTLPWTRSSHWAASASYVSPFINPDETMDTLSHPDRWRSYLAAVGLDAFMLARYSDMMMMMMMMMIAMMMLMMIEMMMMRMYSY
jgi:hypothetical protein